MRIGRFGNPCALAAVARTAQRVAASRQVFIMVSSPSWLPARAQPRAEAPVARGSIVAVARRALLQEGARALLHVRQQAQHLAAIFECDGRFQADRKST